MLRFAALITYGAILCAQTPRFEVASVKPSGPKSVRGEEGGPGKRDPIHYRFDKATFKDLIGIAYDVHYFQISSKASLDRDDFDVEAVVPVGATRDDFRVMMRGLLAERFHLESHLESRIFPAYELQIAKSGAML